MAGLFEYSAAQTGTAIDSVFVYDFEDRIFSAYPVDSSGTNFSESVIGKNNKGSLNRSEILYFDEFTETDTTILHRVSDHFDPMDYPFSAAVKTHLLKGDSLSHNCSGIMISDYWMMTANHCFKIRETHDRSWSADSIHTVYVSPAFHNGTAHPDIGTIEIDKALFFPGNSKITYPDVIFLRLNQPAGRLSGSVAFKSTSNSSDFQEPESVLTFGYPGRYLNHVLNPDKYENIYNADTLYFAQNETHSIDERLITVTGHMNSGQSGSSLLSFQENAWWSVGVLSFTNTSNSRFVYIPPYLVNNIRKVIAIHEPEEPEIVSELKLNQNYPNPFNLSTRIVYEIPDESLVRLEVYDVLGRKVATLIDNAQNEGRHEIIFNASGLSSGVYLYQLHVQNRVLTQKMTLIK